MQIRSIFMAAVVSLGTAFASSSANAAAWIPPTGGNLNFQYANGGDDNGLFGSPTSVDVTGFTFAPNHFVASSANGSAAITSDRMYVDVNSTSGAKTITGVSLGEIGDYTIFGGGGVKAFAYLVVRVLDDTYAGSSRVFSATMVTTPGFPLSTTTSADGEWKGSLLVNLPFPASKLQIVLNNTLQANSSANGSALIQKKLLATDDGGGPGLGIITNNSPEPTTLGVVVGGLIVLARRRKA